MSGDFGNDFITITDEDGKEFELEHLASLEHNGNVYMAFLPADIDEDDDEYGLVLLKSVTENGEEVLATLDDETEQDTVYELFLAMFAEES